MMSLQLARIFIITAGSMLLTNCTSAQYFNPPDSLLTEGFTFTINNQDYSFQIPLGGDVGWHNIYEIDTAELDEQFKILFTVGYDLHASPSKLFDMTHILFGLTRDECCDSESVARYHMQEGHDVSSIGLVNTNAGKAIRLNFVGKNNGYIEMYYVPFDDELMFFFTLRVYKDAAENREFVNVRSAVLTKIVNSFIRIDPR